MEAGEQLASIEGKGLGRSPLVHCRVELPDVTADLLVREGQLLIPTGYDRPRTQSPAQKVNRLPEGMPGLLGSVLGPEEGQQGVTTMEAARGGEGEIAQEGRASGLGENGTDGSVFGPSQLDRPQGAQLDHSREPAGRGVTRR